MQGNGIYIFRTWLIPFSPSRFNHPVSGTAWRRQASMPFSHSSSQSKFRMLPQDDDICCYICAASCLLMAGSFGSTRCKRCTIYSSGHGPKAAALMKAKWQAVAWLTGAQIHRFTLSRKCTARLMAASAARSASSLRSARAGPRLPPPPLPPLQLSPTSCWDV